MMIQIIQQPFYFEFVFIENYERSDHLEFPLNDLDKENPEIFNEILKINDLKTIIFTLFDEENHGYNICYNLRRKCKKFCDENKIKSVFIQNESLQASAALLASGIETNVGEKFFVIVVFKNFAKIYALYQDYLYCRQIKSSEILPSKDFTEIQEKNIEKFYTYKTILCFQAAPLDDEECIKENLEIIKTNLFMEDLTIVNENITKFLPQSCVINAELYSLMGAQKFAVMSPAFVTLGVAFASKLKDSKNILKDSIAFIPEDCALSYSIHTSTNLVDDLIIYKINHHDKLEILKEIKVPQNFPHKNKNVELYLKMDVNSFYEFGICPSGGSNLPFFRIPELNPPKIQLPPQQPKKLYGIQIFFEYNIFKIYVCIGNNYAPLKIDGGVEIPCYLAFHDEKGLVGKEARDLEDKSFILYDFIKILSSSPENLNLNKRWEFKIIRNEEYPLMLEYNTFRGRRKKSSSELMVFIIKWALNKFEEKTGIKPEFVEIGLPPELNINYEKPIKDACKKQNIDVSFCDNFILSHCNLVNFEDLMNL